MDCWPVSKEKSYVRIDRNGLNTAMGEAILKSFYPEKYAEMNIPIEQRSNFIQWSQQHGGKVIQHTPSGHETNNVDIVTYCTEDGKEVQHFNKKIPPHWLIPSAGADPRSVLHALIRHPVERFLSFINRYTMELHSYAEGFDIGYRLDQIFFTLKNTSPDQSFIYNGKQMLSQNQFIGDNRVGIKFYKYSEHVATLIEDLGLKVQPKKAASTLIQSFKLAPAHEEIIIDRYGDDLELFNSIRHPGIVLNA